MATRSMIVTAVRHGAKLPPEPDGKPIDMLSEAGERQMIAVGESFCGKHFRIALVSPKKRAMHSAALILGSSGDEPDLNMRICEGLDYEGLLPETLAVNDIVDAMKYVRTTFAVPTVGAFLLNYPEGYAYHAYWRTSVENVLRHLYDEHFEGDEDRILVVSHSPVIELATGAPSMRFIPEGGAIEFVFSVDGDHVELAGYSMLPNPPVG